MRFLIISLFWLYAFQPVFSCAQDCIPPEQIKVGAENVYTEIANLLPTQPSASERLVNERVLKINAITGGNRDTIPYYQRVHPIPVVIANPNDTFGKKKDAKMNFDGSIQCFATDHHHLSKALAALEGYSHRVPVKIVADLRGYDSPANLYFELFQRGYIYLGLDAAIGAISVTRNNVLALASNIPRTMANLADNPYRYLAERLVNGGFLAPNKKTYHPEFQIGDLISRHLIRIHFRPFDMANPDDWYEEALVIAQKYAVSDMARAEKIPGWLGTCEERLLAK